MTCRSHRRHVARDEDDCIPLAPVAWTKQETQHNTDEGEISLNTRIQDLLREIDVLRYQVMRLSRRLEMSRHQKEYDLRHFTMLKAQSRMLEHDLNVREMYDEMFSVPPSHYVEIQNRDQTSRLDTIFELDDEVVVHSCELNQDGSSRCCCMTI